MRVDGLVCAMKPPAVQLADGTEIAAYTADYVAVRLREAAETLRRMPMPKYGRPQQYGAGYPEIRRDYWEFWNQFIGETPEDDDEAKAQKVLAEEEMNTIRRQASGQDIDAMDEVLDWLFLIKQTRNRRVVWAVAHGFSLRSVGKVDGRSHETMRRIFGQACADIATALNTRI